MSHRSLGFRCSIAAIAASIALTLALAPVEARAAGFYVTDRGVRALGRGGAFVAGADDLHSIWYNPAGLVDAGNGFLVDGSVLVFDNRYTRRALPPGTDSPVGFAPVSSSNAPLPIPTLAVSHNFNQRNWMFAAGLFAPNAVITSYPERPDAPQRYSQYTIEGSLLAVGGLWAAYRPHPMLSIGLGVQALVGSFNARVALSACPATITCQPEDPDWDATAQLRVGPLFAPSANLGVRFTPHPLVSIGVSGQLPFWVSSPATLDVRLPPSAFFDGSMVDGNRANVSFMLAPVVRAGVQVRIPRALDVEAAFVWEGWGVHDQISLSPTRDDAQPNGIRITNARGIGTYDVGATPIARNFQHTYSARLGLERDQDLGREWHLIPRVGLAYETSATATEYTSVLTFDTTKVVASMGLSVSRRRLRIDAVFAFMVANSVELDPRDARLYAVQPFRANEQSPRYAINAGRYDLNVFVAGLGMRYLF